MDFIHADDDADLDVTDVLMRSVVSGDKPLAVHGAAVDFHVDSFFDVTFDAFAAPTPLTAHEAAHVVQQRAGMSMSPGAATVAVERDLDLFVRSETPAKRECGEGEAPPTALGSLLSMLSVHGTDSCGERGVRVGNKQSPLPVRVESSGVVELTGESVRVEAQAENARGSLAIGGNKAKASSEGGVIVLEAPASAPEGSCDVSISHSRSSAGINLVIKHTGAKCDAEKDRLSVVVDGDLTVNGNLRVAGSVESKVATAKAQEAETKV